MERKLRPLLAALMVLLVSQSAVSSRSLDSTSKYQIECTMCAACENPCGQNPSPPPPTPSSSICPPPPSRPSSSGGSYYYSPPPPIGGGTYLPPPSGDGKDYPGPPPPNPIVPHFPFFYYSPPPPKSGSAHLTASSVGCTVASLLLLCLF